MIPCNILMNGLQSGTYDAQLSRLYALDGTGESLDKARARACHVIQGFLDTFHVSSDTLAALYSGPGRTEIGGNHTDHQRGHVLCGSVDLDVLACAAPNGTDVIRIRSEGYPILKIELKDLEVKPSEINTTAALVRGVVAKVHQLGHTLKGFDAYAASTILPGSGLSSSAAFETLVGNILNHL